MKFFGFAKKVLLPLLIGWQLSGSGYGATYHDTQTWLNVTSIGTVYKGHETVHPIQVWLEGQARYGEQSSRLSQDVLRTGLGYLLNANTSVWLGYAYINTKQPLTQNPFIENRVWQQLLWEKMHLRFNLMARLRTEQRFVKHYDKTAYRVRGLLKIKVPFPAHPNWSTIASDEVFWHANDFIGQNSKGFDQNRAFIGLGYTIAPGLIAESGYMNQAIRRVGVPNFVSNIFSLTLGVNW